MMAPEHERQRVLGEAIQQATYLLHAPVDFVTCANSGRIEVRAGSKRVLGTYGYSNGVGPGSGSWHVVFGPVQTVSTPGWLARVLKALRRR